MSETFEAYDQLLNTVEKKVLHPLGLEIDDREAEESGKIVYRIVNLPKDMSLETLREEVYGCLRNTYPRRNPPGSPHGYKIYLPRTTDNITLGSVYVNVLPGDKQCDGVITISGIQPV